MSDAVPEADPLISDYEPTVDATTVVNTVEEEIELKCLQWLLRNPTRLRAVVDSVTEEQPSVTDNKEPKSDEMEVIVLNVHCAGNEPFVGLLSCSIACQTVYLR